MTKSSLSEFLGLLVADTPPSAITSAAVERAKVSLTHNLAVALAGRGRERIAHKIAETNYSLPAQATILHSGCRVSTEGAAFANGALFHARSQDDTHPDSTTHPGAPVMAAALAIAEEYDSTGAEFLEAIIIGYEVLCRIGRDFDQEVTGRGFRAAGVYGVFGATAAAARLMRLTSAQTAHALGIATHLAGGLAQVWQEGSAEFPLQLGFAARNGITAARAAAAGATAARFALEGPRGFFNGYAGCVANPREAWADYDFWQIEEATVKPYPACAILQGPLQVLTELLTQEDLSHHEVAGLVLELNPYEARYPGIDNTGPFASPTATKMSAQFCLGNALLQRRLALSDLELVGDPAILGEVSKIAVIATDEIPERLCRITVQTTDGRQLSSALTETLGRPSTAQIGQFAIGLAEEIGASREELGQLLDLIGDIERQPDISVLVQTAARIGGDRQGRTHPHAEEDAA